MHELPVTSAAAPHAVTPTAHSHEIVPALPIDSAFPFDPTLIAHGLAAWETRLVIGGILGGFLAGRAAGIGMIDFTQPVLQACNVSIRVAFSEVKLVPCRHAVASLRTAAVDRLRGGTGAGTNGANGTSNQAVARRDNAEHGSAGTGELHAVGPIEAVPTRPRIWAIPAAGGAMLLRLFACMLAALSAMIAGRAGLARQRRDRNELPYRRRLDS
jgi:hypothetical protein